MWVRDRNKGARVERWGSKMGKVGRKAGCTDTTRFETLLTSEVRELTCCSVTSCVWRPAPLRGQKPNLKALFSPALCPWEAYTVLTDWVGGSIVPDQALLKCPLSHLSPVFNPHKSSEQSSFQAHDLLDLTVLSAFPCCSRVHGTQKPCRGRNILPDEIIDR